VLGAGCWVLGAGCWVLGAGCWVLGASSPRSHSVTPLGFILAAASLTTRTAKWLIPEVTCNVGRMQQRLELQRKRPSLCDEKWHLRGRRSTAVCSSC
jgi:hypothetical protein